MRCLTSVNSVGARNFEHDRQQKSGESMNHNGLCTNTAGSKAPPKRGRAFLLGLLMAASSLWGAKSTQAGTLTDIDINGNTVPTVGTRDWCAPNPFPPAGAAYISQIVQDPY